MLAAVGARVQVLKGQQHTLHGLLVLGTGALRVVGGEGVQHRPRRPAQLLLIHGALVLLQGAQVAPHAAIGVVHADGLFAVVVGHTESILIWRS